jgi:hypothetical protein
MIKYFIENLHNQGHDMTEELEVETGAEKKVGSAASRREAAIQKMEGDELKEFAMAQSRDLQTAKIILRAAATMFRWLQKPTQAQDIDKFLDSTKT